MYINTLASGEIIRVAQMDDPMKFELMEINPNELNKIKLSKIDEKNVRAVLDYNAKIAVKQILINPDEYRPFVSQHKYNLKSSGLVRVGEFDYAFDIEIKNIWFDASNMRIERIDSETMLLQNITIIPSKVEIDFHVFWE